MSEGGVYPLGRTEWGLRVPYDLSVPTQFIQLSKEGRTCPVEEQLESLLQGWPKKLHTSLGYDPEGSEIYESLCEQPEYYLTRTERRLLERESERIMEAVNPDAIVDLGCGNFEKTQILLHESKKKQRSVTFFPNDIDGSIIESSLPHLRHFYGNELKVQALVGSFNECFTYLAGAETKRLFTFLGSTLGNLTDVERGEFFYRLSGCMNTQDRFLLATDLVKSPRMLEAAYNDAAGILRKTVYQMLVNLNRTYCANFDLDAFDHLARFEPEARRVASYLISKKDQKVRVENLGFEVELEAGEPIEAEFYKKFVLQEVLHELQYHGLVATRVIVDEEMPYALVVLRKESVQDTDFAELVG